MKLKMLKAREGHGDRGTFAWKDLPKPVLVKRKPPLANSPSPKGRSYVVEDDVIDGDGKIFVTLAVTSAIGAVLLALLAWRFGWI